MIVSWEDSDCKKKKDESECKTDLQRRYEARIQELLNSKDKKKQAEGRELQATYEELQAAQETFHVVREGGSGSGELTYRGHPGDLYVEKKGSGSLYGEMPDIQKLAHEFEHGHQFLNGLIGFALNPKNNKWVGYRDDLVDEANAFMAGFKAEPVGHDQTQFLQGLGQAAHFGIDEVIKKLNSGASPYRGRATVQIPITTTSPTFYAIPRTQ
jgi:hypothetical protein